MKRILGCILAIGLMFGMMSTMVFADSSKDKSVASYGHSSKPKYECPCKSCDLTGLNFCKGECNAPGGCKCDCLKCKDARRKPATLTVTHVGITYDIKDHEVSRETLKTEDLSGYKEGDIVSPLTFAKCFPTYVIHTNPELKTLVAGKNTLTIEYVRLGCVKKDATIKVNHIYITEDASAQEKSRTEVEVVDPKQYKENDKVELSSLQAPLAGYKYDTKRNTQTSITLLPGENVVNIYYTRQVRPVPVTVNYVGITLSSGGTKLAEKSLGTDTIQEKYFEGDIIKSGQVKKGDLLEYFQYDATLDETIKLPFYPNIEVPVPTAAEVAATVVEIPVRTTINVYYVYKQSPYIPPTEPTPTITTPAPVETIAEEPAPLAVPTKAPQTGDTTPFVPLLALVALAGTVFGVTKIRFRKAK